MFVAIGQLEGDISHLVGRADVNLSVGDCQGSSGGVGNVPLGGSSEGSRVAKNGGSDSGSELHFDGGGKGDL